MTIVHIIIYLSIVIWILPAFRQYKSNYFFYFLILALTDPLNFTLIKIFGGSNYIVHTIGSYLSLLSIIVFSNDSHHKILMISSLILFFGLGLFAFENWLYIILYINVIISIIFIKRVLVTLFNERLLNLFICALIFYELSVVINLTLMIGGESIQYLFFYITLFFQMFLAFFFTIFTEKSPSLNIQLRSEPQ
jgi:hypothetical protein